MGSGVSTSSVHDSFHQQHHSSEKYKIHSRHNSANLLTPQNIRRTKRGSFEMPKISSQHFTSEMVGDYITKLSPWNEGFGYEGEAFMSHMKFLNYKSRIIDHQIDGSAILTLKTQKQINDLFDELDIVDEKHRNLIQSAFFDLRQHLLQSIHVIRYEDFISLNEFPRCPENMSLLHDLIDIDFSKSFIIFISHCWLRGYSGAEGYSLRPHPDNSKNEKYKLCIDGIQKIIQNLTDSSLQCYIWMDFSCIHQDSNPAGELQHLDEIVKYSDCMFTPVVDNTIWEYIHTNEGDFYDYKASGWCQGEHSYIQRAWCRVEMFYAANVPLSKHVKTKLSAMKFGLKNALENHRRPHFLYGTRESRLCLNPIQLQPLCREYSFFERYHPCKGSVSVQSDLMKIQELVNELKPYLSYPFPLSSTFPSPLVTSRKIPSNLIAQSRVRHLTPEKKTIVAEPSSIQTSSVSSSFQRKRNPTLSPLRATSPSKLNNPAIAPTSNKDIVDPVPAPSFVLDNLLAAQAFIEGEKSDDEDLLSDDNSIPSLDDIADVNRQPNSLPQKSPSVAPSTLPPLELTHSKNSSSTRKTRDINGCIYYGEYRGNDRHGHGQLQYPNGDIFEGIFKNNVIHGKGKYTYGNGDIFVGEWKSGYRHGKGIHTVSDGEVIQELYRNGHKIKGKFIYSDYVFIGSLNKEGFKEGTCIVRYNNGDVYEGKYSNDKREGFGKFTYANGDVFEGYYHNNLRHGKGKFKSHTGDIFTGEYKYDKMDCDEGTYITSKGDIMTGQWRNNMKHGKFKVKYHNGESYNGDYRNNQKHGRGIYVYANTESYTGEYRNGKKHGQGIYRFLNGHEKRGLWSEDSLVENPLAGHGNGIRRSISMKSICNEQIDESKLNDDEISCASHKTTASFVRTSRDSSFTNLLNSAPSSPCPRGYRKNTNISASPNRARSSSDGSDVSVIAIHNRSPMKPRL